MRNSNKTFNRICLLVLLQIVHPIRITTNEGKITIIDNTNNRYYTSDDSNSKGTVKLPCLKNEKKQNIQYWVNSKLQSKNN